MYIYIQNKTRLIDIENRHVVAKQAEMEKGRIASLRLTDANYYIKV